MSTADIAEFVRARLDEDEAMARRNIGAAPGSQNGLGDTEEHGPGYPQYPTYQDEEVDTADEYIACFRPLRMLREVAAKRRMLADLDLTYPDEEHLLKLLALAWSGHPDYRQEWKS